MVLFNKITIIGVGLIGGSVGLAVKKRKLAKEVIGLCRRESSKKKAEKFKAVDWATLDFKTALYDSDLVIVATPAAKIVEFSLKASKFMKKGAVLTDVGSVKDRIVKSIENKIKKDIHFVGSHPLAGSEKSSVLNAKNNMFENSICVLTKTNRTNVTALNKIKKFWQAIGAKVTILLTKEHDQIVSEISHLPHLLAMSLCLSVDKKALRFASSGFKDTTRIAASEAELWSDIFLFNKEVLIKSANKLEKSLKKLKGLINSNSKQALFKELAKAKLIRQNMGTPFKI